MNHGISEVPSFGIGHRRVLDSTLVTFCLFPHCSLISSSILHPLDKPHSFNIARFSDSYIVEFSLRNLPFRSVVTKHFHSKLQANPSKVSSDPASIPGNGKYRRILFQHIVSTGSLKRIWAELLWKIRNKFSNILQ
jgi:hypothetical protein